jgi:tetratricopeptide (TPR) repeat protein
MFAQHQHDAPRTNANRLRLGAVVMANSGAPAAQAPFLDGLAALHSFEYDMAARSFRRAQELDPTFALAYWGEAMTHTHPVWNQQAADSARAILARYAPTPEARRARAPTPRERDWISAVDVLYGEGSKAKRDTLYLQAMQQLALAHPDDLEAQSFLALAWLGLNQSVRSIPDYMRAGAIASRVLQVRPDHPGAAHYVIHAFDDPEHAPLGLDAARAYSRIAPDAPHAQHMTTHIFLALGMWEETVAQNVEAMGTRPQSAGHYTQWWHYGLTQLGRETEATALRDSMRRISGGASPTLNMLFVEAQHAIEFDRWDDKVFATELRSPNNDMQIWWHSIRGIAAAKRGDTTTAQRHIQASTQLLQREAAAPAQAPQRYAMHNMLLASHAHSAGNLTEALTHARAAAALIDTLPADFGPPVLSLPPHELLAELLMASGDAALSQRAWQRALQLAPGRSRALAGLAKAALAAGDSALARESLQQLEANWRRADPVPATLSVLRRAVAGK